MLNEERDEFLGIQDTLKALADPIRREILNLLKNGRLSAGEICEHFSVTGASISRHLAILKDAWDAGQTRSFTACRITGSTSCWNIS